MSAEFVANMEDLLDPYAEPYDPKRPVVHFTAAIDIDGLRDARAELGVLYRLELGERSGDVVLLVQSGVSPDWSHLARGYLAVSAGTMENPATKDVSKSLDALHDGQLLRFRLRANPTRKIETRSTPDGRRQNGRRVDLHTEELQLEWLYRRAGQSGFALYPTRPGIGHQAAVIEGDLDAVGVVAWQHLLGAPFHGRRGWFRVSKPLSQIQRSTFSPFQMASYIHSFGGLGFRGAI